MRWRWVAVGSALLVALALLWWHSGNTSVATLAAVVATMLAATGPVGSWQLSKQSTPDIVRGANGPWHWVVTAAVLALGSVAAGGVRLLGSLAAGPGAFLATISVLSALGAGIALVSYVRARRRRPMALSESVRLLLATQRREAKEHRYSFGAHVPEVNRIYVERRAEIARGPSQLDAGPVTVRQVLVGSRHVVLVADAGGGKSMLAASIARESAAWWLGPRRSKRTLEAPYGPVIATYVPARMLAGTDLARALAAYWSRPGGQIPSETFRNRPARRVDWLIFVDGLDEIADADMRTRVLHYLSDESMRATSPHRIVVTSRSLPPLELGSLGASVYRLRPFGPDDLRDFALRWFSARARLAAESIVLQRFRKHWIVLVNGVWLPTLIGLVMLFIVYALPGVVRLLGTLIILLVWGAWAIVVYLQWSSASLTVRDQRVIAEEGVLTRFRKVIPLDKSLEVSTTQSLLGRILNYGLVEIDAGDPAGAERFDYVNSPEILRDQVFSLSRQQYVEEESGRFLALVHNASLTAMLRVPLLATMAALIYEISQQAGLPTTRTKLYQQFVQVLQNGSMLGPETRPLSAPFDGWLLDVPSGRPELLRALADAQLAGGRNLLLVAVDWVRATEHAGQLGLITYPDLVNRVRYALIASSLFTMDGDQPFFWHQSLAEYVAAAPRGKDFDRAVWRREITSPSTRSLALFRLGRSSEDPERLVRYLRAADPVAAGYVLVDGVTVSAGLRLSVVDGLIAAGQGDGATAVESLTLAEQLSQNSPA